MHEDKDMTQFLSRLEVPAHSPDLAERIIAQSLAQHPPQLRQGRGFGSWWAGLRAEHGPKMAVAASVAILGIMIFNPAGKITEHYMAEQHIAEMERYTVDGVPLLADISLLEEQDLQLDEVVVFSENG